MSENSPEGEPDSLLDELCVYIIDALVNVLIVSGVHGGWYLDPPASSSSSSSSSLPISEHGGMFDSVEAGDAGYMDVYSDPFAGYGTGQLSDMLAVTPTVESYKPEVPSPGPQHAALPAGLPFPTGGPPTSLSHLRTRTPAQAQAEALAKSRARARERAHRERLRESTRSYSHTFLHALLTEKFKPELLKFLSQAKELNTVLGEKVVKCDLELIYVAPGVPYQADRMESLGKVGEGEVSEEAIDKEAEGLASVDEPTTSEGGPRKIDEEGTELLYNLDLDLDDEEGDETPRTRGSPNANVPPAPYRGETERRIQARREEIKRRQQEEREQQQALYSAHPPPPPVPVEDVNAPKVVEEPVNEMEVLCTTELGLNRSKKVPRSRGQWNEDVLVMPQVVLLGEFLHSR